MSKLHGEVEKNHSSISYVVKKKNVNFFFFSGHPALVVDGQFIKKIYANYIQPLLT